MKTSIHLGAALAMVALAVASSIAQTQTTTTTSYIQSTNVIGSKIRDVRGQEVGEIKDFVLDRNTGCLAYVVLSTGGGGATVTRTKTVAAPWTVFSASSEPRVFTTRIEREKIYSAPVWESTRIEEYSRPDYINNVYSYYGVTPGVGVGVQATVGGTSSTVSGSSTQVNASSTAAAAPTATVSPAATASASPNATVSPRAIASPATTATASPTATARAGRSPRGKASATPGSAREESAAGVTTTEPSAGTSPSRSRRHAKQTENTESATQTGSTTATEEPNATPKKSRRHSTESPAPESGTSTESTTTATPPEP